MTTTERLPSDLNPAAETETKTIFSLLSKLKEVDLPDSPHLAENTLENDDDILIVKKIPNSNETSINKSVYLKLHRSDSPSRSIQFDKIKDSFERNPKNKPVPAPKPRGLKTKSQIITPTKKDEDLKPSRHSWNVPKIKHKDVNSNNLKEELSSEEEEFVTIVTLDRSDSEESVLRFEKELSAFTMDKKKRTSSFKKIFSVFSSNKDKKKKHQDKTLNGQNKENGETYSDNFNNESNSFSRQSTYRHTLANDSPRVPNSFTHDQLTNEFAQHQINQLSQYRQNLENSSSHLKPEMTNKLPNQGYTPMDKPINFKNNDSYVNIHKYIDTSSSASTLESSDRSNLYQNEVLRKESEEVQVRYPQNSFRPNRIYDNRRDTPPRLMETQQDVRLVNPKALIPINSERPLPNPYQNGNREQSPMHSSTPSSRPHLDDTYGIVFDSLEKARSKLMEKPPRSPSVEPSKLRLPPNREITPLSPRIRSPIPPENIPTEKIIATELLKPKRSPTPVKKHLRPDEPSHQRLDIDIDYPDNLDYTSKEDNLVTKPPLANKKVLIERLDQMSRSSNESVALRQRLSQASPNSDRFTTNAQVHINSPINRTPTPSYSLSSQNLSISPNRSNNRPSTPSNSQISQSPKTTPQKQEIRKTVEAYYWNEIKKLKDQENYELYLMQMQYNNLNDNASIRRSRSMSPTADRNSRRSLSLPREARPQVFIYPNAIPENRAVMQQPQPRSMQQLQFQQERQQFQRNTPERSTVDGSPRKFDNSSTNSLYRPIFKRGSLSTPPRQADDSLKRKVSFSGSKEPNPPVWPTRNGYTQSPPQRRDNRQQNQSDDDVFYAQNNEILRTNQRNDLPSEDIYYNYRPEPTYVARGQRNGVYIQQPQAPVENPYGQRILQNQRRLIPHAEEALYGQPIDAVPLMTRHGSIQIQEELYGPRPVRRLSYQNNSRVPPNQEIQYMPRRPPSVQSIQHPQMKREIIVNDEIFGQFGGYAGPNNNIRMAPSQNIYSSRQSVVDYNAPYVTRPHPKQITLSNKVCDMYGQIHDTDAAKVRQSGVIMGQLQQSPGSPPVARNTYNNSQQQQQFVRNSRLTASASDMYRRAQQQQQIPPPPPQNESMYGRVQQNGAPTRPLPPVPNKKLVGRGAMVSDTESGSDASEIQRILNSGGGKGKKKGLFGK